MPKMMSLKTTSWDEGIQPISLGESERVLACSAIAREKIEIGDYDAGCIVLAPWWVHGEWPNLAGLDRLAAAELLLIAGTLTNSVARVKRIVGGQRLAEALINGAVALFNHLAKKTRVVEARIELGCCYYHQGLFDLAHATLRSCVASLPCEDYELRAVALIRLAIVERHSGRLHEALCLLEQVEAAVEDMATPWTKGRFHTEMANTVKELGAAEGQRDYFDRALIHYKEASMQFEQVGNLRYVAAVENNRGHLLLNLERFEASQTHLERARNLFSGLADTIGCAQVDETMAQLYLG
jgi:tetratricopeptide (TPR) repeat protein